MNKQTKEMIDYMLDDKDSSIKIGRTTAAAFYSGFLTGKLSKKELDNLPDESKYFIQSCAKIAKSTMEERFCNGCHNINDKDSKFCKHCGEKVA